MKITILGATGSLGKRLLSQIVEGNAMNLSDLEIAVKGSVY